ncbi:hypothetical protein F2P56_019350 [Juglans regia]|uniref:Uncharacterized GPI-anchored protein At3g06035-like n=2 Tax=Juglans regia TaxID=51240 RepID=A0A2I4GCP3_JUGRE|nr:uncharacterized GPI-anchored protein At3g06035-like [Juglans regia]KAF5463435.1 hypothetical protein F2P56_019350 [Juglans regia]
MAFVKLGLSLLLLVLIHGVIFLSDPVLCDDEDDTLFQGINSYRQSLNLPEFTENDNAGCLADEIADQLEDLPCDNASDYSFAPGTTPKFSNFNKLLHSCHINVNNTVDGVLMPVCVPKLDPTLVLSNYTNSQYAKYLNDSSYTGAGIASEDDWIVVILSTNTSTGNFSGVASLVPNIMVNYMVALLFSLLLVFLS